MKPTYAAILVGLALSALTGCVVSTSAFTNLPIEAAKPKFEGAKVSGKRVAIVDVADAREDKSTYFVGNDKYTSPSNLRSVFRESFAATLQAAGFQTVEKDAPADVKLTVTLTVARSEGGGYGRPGVGVVAARLSAETATGTFERTIVGRDRSISVMGGAADEVQGALHDAIAVTSVEATKACVELVKLELGGT